MSWKWFSHKIRVGESLVWVASIWSLVNHFLSLSLFPFPPLTWPLVCDFWKAAMCLCAPAAQSTAVLQTHTDLEAHPKCNMEKSIVLLTGLCAATLPHACSMLEKSSGKPQDSLQNRALFRMSERDRIPPIIYFSSTPENLQETESPLRGTPWMNAHKEGPP